MEQGEFDDLPGKGKPVDTSENPFEDPALRLAHRMLRNAGFAPSWIEERKDIDSEFENARNELSRMWAVLQNALGTENERGARARWEQALTSPKAGRRTQPANRGVELKGPGSRLSKTADRYRKRSQPGRTFRRT